MKITETSSVEFFSHYDTMYVQYNGKHMTLEKFIKDARYDTDIAKALSAIKDKMQSLKFKGTIIDFIYLYFRDKNSTPDVMIHNGTQCYYTKHDPVGEEEFVTFDTAEIASAEKDLNEVILDTEKFINMLI